MARKRVDVRMRNLRWAVEHADAPDPVSTHDQRHDAIRAARALARDLDAEVVVYGLDDRPLETQGDGPGEPGQGERS
jgi:hypothetical protein